MIDVSLDKFGNNLWTLAAENGTVKIMNYLINILYSWETEDLNRVLHFQTCHREHSCMEIVEKYQPNLLAIPYSDSKFEGLKNCMHINITDPSKLRDHLKALKKHLDATIDSLDMTIRKMRIWDGERKAPNQLRRTLVYLRKRLVSNDLKWHHISLAGIISKNYPPNCIIVQKIIVLEIMCHEKSPTNLTENEQTNENTNCCINISSCCMPKEQEHGNQIELEPIHQNLNATSDENEEHKGLIPKPKDKENYLESNMAFLSCMYNRVGKSPCTVAALEMASETYPLTTEMPEMKCNMIPSILWFLLRNKPFWTCLILFFFSFSLLVADFTTDVLMVVDLYSQNTSYSCLRNISEFNLTGLQTTEVILQKPDSATTRQYLFWATLITVILPFPGYVILWVNTQHLGFRDLKNKVGLETHLV